MRVRVAIIFQFPRRPTASLKIHRNFGFGSRWLVSANCIELLAFVPLKREKTQLFDRASAGMGVQGFWRGICWIFQ